MTIDKNSRDYEICQCNHITRGYVNDMIRAQKITDLKTLCVTLSIGNRCGGCREMLDQMLEAYKAELE